MHLNRRACSFMYMNALWMHMDVPFGLHTLCLRRPNVPPPTPLPAGVAGQAAYENTAREMKRSKAAVLPGTDAGREMETSNRASDARSAGGSNLGRAQGARAMLGGMGGEQACGAGLRGAAHSRLRACKARMMRYCMRTCILVCSPVTAEV